MSEMKHDDHKKNTGLRLVLPFFLTLAVLTVVSFLIPLRPTVSESEKRELTKFPEFSVEALVSGSYFDEITLWFSDTFPGRESWLELSHYTSNFHGYAEIAIEGPLESFDEIPVADESIPQETEPEATEPLSTGETQSTDAAETTEPTEEGWGGVDLKEYEEISLGAAIQIGDTGYNQSTFSKVNSDRYIRSVNRLAEKLEEKGVRLISAPCPTAVGVMIAPEDLEQITCANQKDMLDYLHNGMDDYVITVDTVTNMREHNDEYLYFRTDHHWTQLGAYYAYEALCEETDMEAPSLDSFTLWNQGEFVGSLYGKVRWPRKLRIDSMDCYVPQGDITFYAHFKDNSAGTEWPLIADRTELNKNSRYSAFLASDCAMAHVINEDNAGGPNALVWKDSFGNCYVPFLTQNYHHVYALDYRKYWAMTTTSFCDRYDIDDVILLPYMIATQATDGNDMFKTHFQ